MAFKKIITLDLSGFGGGYENHCQLLLQAGLDILEERPELDAKIGSDSAMRDEFCQMMSKRALQAYPEAEREANGSTGAQVGVASSAALFIKRKGRIAWIAEVFRIGRQADLYEWDGTESSVPVAEGKNDDAKTEI